MAASVGTGNEPQGCDPLRGVRDRIGMRARWGSHAWRGAWGSNRDARSVGVARVAGCNSRRWRESPGRCPGLCKAAAPWRGRPEGQTASGTEGRRQSPEPRRGAGIVGGGSDAAFAPGSSPCVRPPVRCVTDETPYRPPPSRVQPRESPTADGDCPGVTVPLPVDPSGRPRQGAAALHRPGHRPGDSRHRRELHPATRATPPSAHPGPIPTHPATRATPTDRASRSNPAPHAARPEGCSRRDLVQGFVSGGAVVHPETAVFRGRRVTRGDRRPNGRHTRPGTSREPDVQVVPDGRDPSRRTGNPGCCCGSWACCCCATRNAGSRRRCCSTTHRGSHGCR